MNLLINNQQPECIVIINAVHPELRDYIEMGYELKLNAKKKECLDFAEIYYDEKDITEDEKVLHIIH